MNKLLQYLMNQPNVQHRVLPGLQKFQRSVQPCYECGGSVKRYDVGGFYDCPDQEKDPVTGKCKAEVVRGREAAAANKAANADMNAWAKQVAAMDKENAKQYAAQAAGQLTFDYDWMQSPLDKADKKAAMAASKQFFQQNPNVFVADDTSGYSTEQKYIIASKLKQRMSTPMGSKLVQQKYGVDPRFYDLQRIQSDFAPKMGGWNGMRNFLFNVYKQQGGEYDLPQAQWGSFVNPTTIAAMATMAEKAKEFFGFNEPKIVRTPASAPKRLSIRDPRKVMMTTGKPLRPNSDLVSGDYDSEDLGNLLTEAKRRKMSYNDMMNLAAMGFQETKWGKTDPNIGHTQDIFGDDPNPDAYENFINAYNAKMKDADRLKIKDEATRLQVYNGLGKVFPSTEADYHGFKMKKIYGVPVPKEGINLRKNPLYGKQVIDIRDNVLKRNPEFMRYMDSTYKAPMPKEKEFANGGPILDPRGQWAHPGKVTRIPSPNITMQGVPYPVYGVGSNGQEQMMYPEQEYNFGGASYVDEYPMMQSGGWSGGGLSRSNLAMMSALNKDIKDQKARDAQVTISQYTPKPGDQQRMNAAKDAYRAEQAKPLNRLANNPHIIAGDKNLPGAIEFALDVMTAGEAGAALNTIAKPGLKAAGKYLTEKIALKNKSNFNTYNPVSGSRDLAINNILENPIDEYRNLDVFLLAKDTHKQVENEMIKRSGIENKALGEIEGLNLGVRRSFPTSKYKFSNEPYNPFSEYGYGAYDEQALKQSYSDSFDDYINWKQNMLKKLPKNKNGGGLLSKSVSCSNCGHSWKSVEGGIDPLTCHKCGGVVKMKTGGQHGGLDRWFAEKWVDVKTGKDCGRQEGEKRAGYPACRPSKRVSSETPKTSSEMSSAEKAKFKANKTSSQRINYNHKRNK
jgi:hypothetical protein